MVFAMLFLAVGVAAAPGGDLLPDVDALMGTAETSVKEFTKQTGFMRQEVRSRQQHMQEQLELRRQVLEQNLSAVDAHIAVVVARNSELHTQYQNMVNVTEAQKAEAKKLQTSNNFMREALGALQSKLATVRDFLAESINSTDQVGARELSVLDAPTGPPTMENFLSVVDHMSLLSTHGGLSSGGVPPALAANPGQAQVSDKSMVSELDHQVKDLAAAAADGEAQLMGQFLAKRELKEKRLGEVEEEGRRLTSMIDGLVEEAASLDRAIGQLNQARLDLAARITGMKRFSELSRQRNRLAMESATKALSVALAQATALLNEPVALPVNITADGLAKSF